MPSWFSRLFRSRAESHAERAEVDGRFEDAARLYVEAGQRERAVELLLRAAEVTVDLPGRRGLLTRAHTLATTEVQRGAVREALAQCTLAEFEALPPRNDDDRQRLRTAAAELEAKQDYRAAARAWKLLGDARATERVLMLAGDLEAFESEAGRDQEEQRTTLRRRTALQAFDTEWRSGDRTAALETLTQWLGQEGQGDDDEVRRLLDQKKSSLLSGAVLRVSYDGQERTVALRFPLTLGREGAVSLRGAGVSREHALVVVEEGRLCIKDNGSRNGTKVQGLVVSGTLPLEVGHTVTLGTDLTLRVEEEPGALALVVDRGLDQGRRVVLCTGPWRVPFGALAVEQGKCVFKPKEPVLLDGQKLVVPIVLARGDRITAGEHLLEFH